MLQNEHKWAKRVAGVIECLFCKGFCKKNGKTGAAKQRYKCKSCNKTFIIEYTYQAYKLTDMSISTLLKEGCGIRSIARILHISPADSSLRSERQQSPGIVQ